MIVKPYEQYNVVVIQDSGFSWVRYKIEFYDPSFPTWAIIAIILGGTIFIAVIWIVIYIYKKRNKRQQEAFNP